MKIGFDVSQTCVEKAGCGYYADSLATALAKTFPEHEIILYHHFGRWLNESTSDGTSIELPNVTSPLKDWSMEQARELWSADTIDASILGNPEVVVGNNFQMPAIPDCFRIFTVHDISFWTRPQYHTEANRLACQKGLLEALENANGFAFVSNYSRSSFQSLFPSWLETRKSAVTHLASRGKRKCNITRNLDLRNYWLFVGSLEPRKNVEVLLDAYELYFKKSSAPKPLKLAGGAGWKSERTKSRLEDMAKSMSIEHLGYVSDQELEQLYAESFGFIFPSWYEGFGLPVVEAMNQGTPVITSLESSLKEIAEGFALSFNPESPEELCKQMLLLESDSSIWKTYQESSLRRTEDFNWENTAQDLSNLFME